MNILYGVPRGVLRAIVLAGPVLVVFVLALPVWTIAIFISEETPSDFKKEWLSSFKPFISYFRPFLAVFSRKQTFPF